MSHLLSADNMALVFEIAEQLQCEQNNSGPYTREKIEGEHGKKFVVEGKEVVSKMEIRMNVKILYVVTCSRPGAVVSVEMEVHRRM